jgi:hypothetical protein
VGGEAGVGELPLSARPAMWYHTKMTKLLDTAVETVRRLPPEIQDDLARVLLQMAGEDQPVVALTSEEAASFDESLRQAERGQFATDDQVRAIWAKHGL